MRDARRCPGANPGKAASSDRLSNPDHAAKNGRPAGLAPSRTLSVASAASAPRMTRRHPPARAERAALHPSPVPRTLRCQERCCSLTSAALTVVHRSLRGVAAYGGTSSSRWVATKECFPPIAPEEVGGRDVRLRGARHSACSLSSAASRAPLQGCAQCSVGGFQGRCKTVPMCSADQLRRNESHQGHTPLMR
jgi:hypothetical protein